MDQINQIFGYSFCIMEGGGILRNNSDGKKSLKSYLTNLTTSLWKVRTSLRPRRLCGEISILDKNDINQNNQMNQINQINQMNVFNQMGEVF